VLRLDAVERRERAAEHVVEAAELARPLDGDQIDRLLDHADHRVVAAGVPADRADLVLRQVAALVAEANSLLDLLDRGRERERLVLRPLQEMESEPVGGPRADARQARELADEILHSRAEHRPIVPTCLGLPRLAFFLFF
jgi:hypothetical protein